MGTDAGTDNYRIIQNKLPFRLNGAIRSFNDDRLQYHTDTVSGHKGDQKYGPQSPGGQRVQKRSDLSAVDGQHGDGKNIVDVYTHGSCFPNPNQAAGTTGVVKGRLQRRIDAGFFRFRNPQARRREPAAAEADQRAGCEFLIQLL